MRRLACACLLALTAAFAGAQITVSDTLHKPDGSFPSGTATISWPAFTTSGSLAVAAGSMTVTIGANGAFSAPLQPNQGGSPTIYYKVVFSLSDGTEATEFWVVPTSGPKTVAQVRSSSVPPTILPVGSGGGGSGNATKLQNINVDSTAPTDNQILSYVAATTKWTPTSAVKSACPAGSPSNSVCWQVTKSDGTAIIVSTNDGKITIGSGAGGQLTVGTLYGALAAVTFSTTPSCDLGVSKACVLTLTGDATSYTLANLPTTTTTSVLLEECQDSTGGWNLPSPSNVKNFSEVRVIGASKCVKQMCDSDGSNLVCGPGVIF